MEAAWILGVDLAACDARFGRDQVDRLLQDHRPHAAPPVVDSAGRLTVSLARGPRESAPVVVHTRLKQGALEVSCSAERGRSYVCEHVVRAFVDLAVSPALRASLVAGTPVSTDDLPDLARATYEERTLDERLAQWLPPRAFDDAFEIDVEPVRSAGLAAADERPALVVRHRRPGARVLVKPREVLDARLRPRHRRLVELTAPGHTDRTTLVSIRAQASMLLGLLRDEQPIFTRNWKSRLRFAKEPVRPRVDIANDRLVARWVAEDGAIVSDAEDALLFSGAFAFVWSEALEIFHPVAADVDLDVAWGLSRVPSLPLPPHMKEEIGRALLRGPRGLGISLPGPEAFGLPPLVAPSFELRLVGTPLDVRGSLTVKDGIPTALAEQQAFEALDAAGLARDDESSVFASEERAVMLWTTGLTALRESSEPRFTVLLDEALARAKVGPPVNVDVHVAIASGWLETELDFRAGSLKVEMERLRKVLSDRGRWVELSDGTIAKISEEIAALVDEAGRSGLGDTGHARLAPHHLGRLERWIDRFGGELDEQATTLRSRLRALAVDASPKLPARLEATLRPYQDRGLAWLQFLRELGAGGVLADDMGLGKTLMTLAHLARWKDDAGSAPSLVVCPTSVVGNWVKEAARFTPQLSVQVLHGGDAIGASDLVVTTYALLRRNAETLAAVRFRCVVLDEAQNVKNAAAATSRAARRLDAEQRLALSGTPIENRLAELWSILTFANPGMLGERHAFEDRFERPITNEPNGAVAEELRATVRPFVLRRTKAEVLGDLPPKTEIDVSCVLGLRQKRMYDALALSLRQAVRKDVEKRGFGRSRMSVLTAILRLRQMACDPRLVDPSAPPADSAKRIAFLELARQLLAEGRRALVFSQFTGLLSLWREDLDREKIGYEYLDGSSTDRDRTVERFQNGSAPLFLISLKAGGAGLNLTAADTVVHCDPWWNPAVEDQATDRAHRLGQQRPVTVIRLVARSTIEDKIALLKEKKRELAASVIDDAAGEGALEGLTSEDVSLLLDGIGSEAPAAEVPLEPIRRFVRTSEIDALRSVLKRIESSGTPRKDLARLVGLPLARLTLLLIGHRVPITSIAAERIRAFDRKRDARLTASEDRKAP